MSSPAGSLNLASLVERGLVTKSEDPTHVQKAVYSLTEKGLDLLPVVIALSTWAQKHHAETRRPEAVQVLQGGPKLQRELERQLRRDHGIA